MLFFLKYKTRSYEIHFSIRSYDTKIQIQSYDTKIQIRSCGTKIQIGSYDTKIINLELRIATGSYTRSECTGILWANGCLYCLCVNCNSLGICLKSTM